MELLREMGARGTIAWVLLGLGSDAWYLGHLAQAQIYYQESLARFEAIGLSYGAAIEPARKQSLQTRNS